MEFQRAATPLDSAHVGAPPSLPRRQLWTPDQMVRLENEWRRLQRNYAYHPHVRVVPLSGNPPCEYQIEYHAKTLHIRDDGQLDYLSTPSVHIWLPPGFPHEAPLVRPMQSIFHPNVVAEGILLAPAWQPMQTLAEVVKQIGALLTFQTYDPYTVWNAAAMDWVNSNATFLPTDPAAEFSPDVPNDPLERICRNAPASIQQLRQQLEELCSSMLQPADPPSAEEVGAFAEQVRLAAALFMDDDVPDTLRENAKELDEWAQGLPMTVMYFEGLRQRHITSASALQAAGKIAEARRALLKELTALEQLCQASPRNVAEALAALPEPGQLELALANLQVVTAEAQKRLSAAKTRLSALVLPDPRGQQTLSDLLEARIEQEIVRAKKLVQDAMDKTRSAIETISPTVERAVDELAALQQVMGWREFADLTTKARGVVDQIVAWGSAGVQAYFISNDGGEYGPYEFEQKLDFGEWSLVCRNVGSTALEVWELHAGKRMGASEGGQITVALKASDGARYPTTFRLTARCDELQIQVDYLTRQIGDLLVRQAKAPVAAKALSWAAGFSRMLASPAILQAIADATRKDVQRRTSLVHDLHALSHYKERLTTSFLLERHGQDVPKLLERLRDAKKALAESNERIAFIFARSQRDLENDQPMVPPKFAKEYEVNKIKRDEALAAIEKCQRLMQVAVQQITPRVTNPTLYGSDEVPSPTVLPPLPEELLARAPYMSEEVMAEQIAGLEELLGVKLSPEAPAAPEPVGVRPADLAGTGIGEHDSAAAAGNGEAEVSMEDHAGAESHHDVDSVEGGGQQSAGGGEFVIEDDSGHQEG